VASRTGAADGRGRLQGKVAIITEAARGHGRSHAVVDADHARRQLEARYVTGVLLPVDAGAGAK
jgi:hypothetical protein